MITVFFEFENLPKFYIEDFISFCSKTSAENTWNISGSQEEKANRSSWQKLDCEKLANVRSNSSFQVLTFILGLFSFRRQNIFLDFLQEKLLCISQVLQWIIYQISHLDLIVFHSLPKYCDYKFKHFPICKGKQRYYFSS